MERIPHQKLCEITHTTHKSKQIKWLQKNGIPFYFDLDDRPVVFKEHFEGQTSAKVTPSKQTSKWQPPPM